MKFSFTLETKDEKTGARAGIIETPHGVIMTPAFSVVGTRATVRGLSPEDLKEAGSQVVLANTYHLYLRPGTDVIKKFGGFAPFMGWDGPTITDSGGYQVSFLWPRAAKVAGVGTSPNKDGARVSKISDSGATFISHIDGSKHLLTPEKSIGIQAVLGADIIMAFDQPLASADSEKKIKDAVRRTLLWEERSFKAWKELKTNQALYGIIQGGLDKTLRREFMKFILDTGFPGIAIGDETIGATPRVTAEALDTITDMLPDDKPFHALGLGGGPEGIFEAVERGVDTFDNTSITRMARSGLLFVYPEDGGTKINKFRLDITKGKFKDEKSPLSKICKCRACKNYSKAYLHHLLVSGELLGLQLATLHNVTYINDLMTKIRNAIINGDFISLKQKWLNR